jgi:hypothetical protein
VNREHRTSESSELGITSDDSQEMRLFATSPPERLHKRSGVGLQQVFQVLRTALARAEYR